jgi:hypothetical protein
VRAYLILIALLAAGCRPSPERLELSPASLQFDTLFAGQAESRNIKVTNPSLHPVALEWMLEAPFELVTPARVAEPGVTEVLVRFNPAYSGDFHSSLGLRVDGEPHARAELIGLAEDPPPMFAAGSP